MPSARIFSRLELAAPILCDNKDCQHAEIPINVVLFPMDEEDSFYESYGNGGENEDSDFCKKCKNFGILSDPLAYFFYSLCDEENRVIAIDINLDLIESLTRILKNFQEEGDTAHQKVYLASDPMCNCFDGFHVFESDDFAQEWDFDKPSYNERNKVIIVSKIGVCLSCDISTKGDNEQEQGTVSTCWFTLVDLAELNSWVVTRVGINREE